MRKNCVVPNTRLYKKIITIPRLKTIIQNMSGVLKHRKKLMATTIFNSYNCWQTLIKRWVFMRNKWRWHLLKWTQTPALGYIEQFVPEWIEILVCFQISNELASFTNDVDSFFERGIFWLQQCVWYIQFAHMSWAAGSHIVEKRNWTLVTRLRSLLAINMASPFFCSHK